MIEFYCRTILQIAGLCNPIYLYINILQYCFQTKQGNIRDIFLCLTLTFVTNISICSIPSSINPLRDFLFDINCCKVLLNSRKCNFGKQKKPILLQRRKHVFQEHSILQNRRYKRYQECKRCVFHIMISFAKLTIIYIFGACKYKIILHLNREPSGVVQFRGYKIRVL